MRLPRDWSGSDLAKALGRFGYAITRQKGSHIRLTTQLPSEHHVTIPNHDPLRIGTLKAILNSVAIHLAVSRDDLLTSLFAEFD